MLYYICSMEIKEMPVIDITDRFSQAKRSRVKEGKKITILPMPLNGNKWRVWNETNPDGSVRMMAQQFKPGT